MSSWKTRWAAVALALSPPLLHFSLPYPDCQSLVTASLLLVVDGHDSRPRPQPRQPRQSRCGRGLEPRLLTTDLWIVWRLIYSRPGFICGFLIARESWNLLSDEAVVYGGSGTMIQVRFFGIDGRRIVKQSFFFFRKLLQTWLIGSLYSIRVNVISKKHFVSFHSIV